MLIAQRIGEVITSLPDAPLVRHAASRRGLVLLFLVFYGLGTLGILARYEWNPTALVRFGHYYVEQNPERTPAGAIRFTGNEAHGGNGYDGQIFYYYARTFFEPGVWPEGFSLAYRAPRAGYPLLAAPFAALFGDPGGVFGLYFAQLALLIGSLLCVHALLPAERKWAAIFYALSPFAFMAYSLLVSDSIMIGLVFAGYYFYLRADARYEAPEGAAAVFASASGRAVGLACAGVFFSLAIFAKESALFFLFPLGLQALWQRRIDRAAFMLAILVPVFAWQLYLREAHGMVPAEVLSIFLAPFDGVFGVARETLRLLGVFVEQPGAGAAIALVKHGAKILLVAALATSLVLPFTGAWRGQSFLPFRLGLILTAAHIIIADWFYFWGIFDNVGRMFTLLVPLAVLLKGQDRSARTAPFFLVTALLGAFVLIRAVFLTPAFPYDVYEPYSGPQYEQAPSGPAD